MTDNESDIRKQKKASFEQNIKILDHNLQEWKKTKKRILTDEKIDLLCRLAEKNVKNRQLSHAQTQMKTDIHQTIGYAYYDIINLTRNGFIGNTWIWDPETYGGKKSKIIYDPKKIWMQYFTWDSIYDLIRNLVSLYGDRYASVISKAICDGLLERPENDDLEISVPIIKEIKTVKPISRKGQIIRPMKGPCLFQKYLGYKENP